jgi:hypothetical protein
MAFCAWQIFGLRKVHEIGSRAGDPYFLGLKSYAARFVVHFNQVTDEQTLVPCLSAQQCVFPGYQLISASNRAGYTENGEENQMTITVCSVHAYYIGLRYMKAFTAIGPEKLKANSA